MYLELVTSLIIGICCGVFTGLAPGIHINLIAAILVSSISKFQFINPLAAAVFIVAMSITHTFIDFIPSIFLGAPSEDNFLSILPGHQMFLKGRAHEAVVYTLYGSLSALLTLLISIPIFLFFLGNIYQLMSSIIPFILIFISCYLILREERIFISFFVFALSGILGLLVFNSPIKEPLLPLLTGLFGISNLIITLNSTNPIVKQKIPKLKEISLTKIEFLKAFIPASLISPFLSVLPGLSSSHVATIASEIITQGKKGFLFMMGLINTIIMSLTFITVFTIGKTRSGSAVAVKEILNTITNQDILVIVLTIFISSFIAFFMGVYLSKSFSKYMGKINYNLLNIIVIVILFVVNLLFTNTLGILVLVTSSALGIFAILSNSRRINLMGSLILPVIVYYLT